MRFLSVICCAAGLVGLAAPAAPAADGAWGTIKGKVTWAGGAAPERTPLKVDKDQGVCLAKGAVLSETYVVNPKNKGVRWVVVYLVDSTDPKKPLPIHPAL